MLRFLSFSAAILAAAGPGMAQPFSRSMAGCTGPFEAVLNRITEPGNLGKPGPVAAVRAAARDGAGDCRSFADGLGVGIDLD